MIRRCVNIGEVTAAGLSGAIVGGAGRGTGSVLYCYNKGKISSTEPPSNFSTYKGAFGGICGSSSKLFTIKYCYSIGEMDCFNTPIGLIIGSGDNSLTFKNNYALEYSTYNLIGNKTADNTNKKITKGTTNSDDNELTRMDTRTNKYKFKSI